VLNLPGAIEGALEEQSRQLLLPTPAETDEVHATVKQEQTPLLTRMQRRKQQQWQCRLDLYEKVMQLHSEGRSQRAIGTALQINARLYGDGCELVSFPSAKRLHQELQRSISSLIVSASDWTEGCDNATKLFGKIRKQGYRGQRGMVAQFVSGWRSSKRPPPAPQPRRVSATQVAILATCSPDQLTAEQRILLAAALLELSATALDANAGIGFS
jgi:hypothetical protein